MLSQLFTSSRHSPDINYSEWKAGPSNYRELRRNYHILLDTTVPLSYPPPRPTKFFWSSLKLKTQVTNQLITFVLAQCPSGLAAPVTRIPSNTCTKWGILDLAYLKYVKQVLTIFFGDLRNRWVFKVFKYNWYVYFLNFTSASSSYSISTEHKLQNKDYLIQKFRYSAHCHLLH